MARQIPLNFQAPPSPNVVSFSFTDIAQGRGTLTLYGFWHQEDGGSIEYKLTENASLKSHQQYRSKSSSFTTSYAKEWDLDFDIEMGRPIIFDGQFTANIPISMTSDSGFSVGAYPHVRVRKWDGATETEIANGKGTEQGAAAGATESWTHVVAFDIPRTKFKKGEYLRITVEVWARSSSGTPTGDTRIGTDPANRAASTLFPDAGHTDTRLAMYMPIALEPSL